MFPAKLFPAFIIFVLANNVAAQQKQGDFDLLCEGEKVTTIGGNLTERVPFSDVWTISPSRSQVSKQTPGLSDSWYSATISANTIEWHKEYRRPDSKAFASYQIDRRSQVYQATFTAESPKFDDLLERSNGKCSILSSPKF